MATRSILLSLAVAILTAGCGAGAGTGTGSRVDANLISLEEIAEEGPTNAYNLVQALRPTWLQKRGPTSFENEGEVRVYLDGTSLGGIESLRGIHTDNIQTIQFLDERRASYRFGPGHEQGVILVTQK